MKWITREGAKVDRIACPWLITRFIDSKAEFLFVPKEKVIELSRKENAIPFDVSGAELTHYTERGDERVSFDSFIKKYSLSDPALLELAKIVKGADANIENARPESAGLKAVALGFAKISKDDFENMRLQFPLYDALYAYCKINIS